MTLDKVFKIAIALAFFVLLKYLAFLLYRRNTEYPKNGVQDNKQDADNALIWIAYIITALVIILWGGSYFVLKNLQFDDRGTLGDMFGSINSLFSGLALAGIIFTILLQRKELELQRRELKDTRKEFELQNTTLKQQTFEETFFNLLKNQLQIPPLINATFVKFNGLRNYPEFVRNGWMFFRQSKIELKAIYNALQHINFDYLDEDSYSPALREPLPPDEEDEVLDNMKHGFTTKIYKIKKETWEL